MPPQDDFSQYRVNTSAGAGGQQDEFAQYKVAAQQPSTPSLSQMTPQQAMDMNRQTSAFALQNMQKQQRGILPGQNILQPDSAIADSPAMAAMRQWIPTLSGTGRAIKGAGTDVGGAIKGLANLPVPQTDAEKKMFAFNPLIAPAIIAAKHAGQGYMQATSDTYDRARQQALQGDTTGSMINSVAAGVPLLGPLVGGVYEQAKQDPATALGTGTSRVAQALMMTPKGSVLPNPVSAATAKIVGGVRGAVTAGPEVSGPAMRGLTGRDFSPQAIDHLQGTANEMGLKPSDFKKGNIEAHANAQRVYATAGQKLAGMYDYLLQPIRNSVSQMPGLPPALRTKLAGQFASTDAQLASRIMSGQTTVGDLDTLRTQLNRLYKDPVYEAPEQEALKDFGTQVRNQLYQEMTNAGADPAEVAQLKKLQGELIANQPGFKGGTKTAGTQNNIANAGSPLQNVLRNSQLMKFRGGLAKGAVETATGSTDSASLLQNAFKNIKGKQSFQMQSATNAPVQPGPYGYLPRGALQTPPPQYGGAQAVTQTPPVAATTRAMRLGLLLPQETGGVRLPANVPSTVQGGQPGFANYLTEPTGTPVRNINDYGTGNLPPDMTAGALDSHGIGAASEEEQSRPGINYVISKTGQPTFHGKVFDPGSTPEGATHVSLMPENGSVRTNMGKLTPIQQATVNRLMEEHGVRPTGSSGHHYIITKSGQATLQKAFDPSATPVGSTHVTLTDDGEVRTNSGSLNAMQNSTVKTLLKEWGKKPKK